MPQVAEDIRMPSFFLKNLTDGWISIGWTTMLAHGKSLLVFYRLCIFLQPVKRKNVASLQLVVFLRIDYICFARIKLSVDCRVLSILCRLVLAQFFTCFVCVWLLPRWTHHAYDVCVAKGHLCWYCLGFLRRLCCYPWRNGVDSWVFCSCTDLWQLLPQAPTLVESSTRVFWMRFCFLNCAYYFCWLALLDIAAFCRFAFVSLGNILVKSALKVSRWTSWDASPAHDATKILNVRTCVV